MGKQCTKLSDRWQKVKTLMTTRKIYPCTTTTHPNMQNGISLNKPWEFPPADRTRPEGEWKFKDMVQNGCTQIVKPETFDVEIWDKSYSPRGRPRNVAPLCHISLLWNFYWARNTLHFVIKMYLVTKNKQGLDIVQLFECLLYIKALRNAHFNILKMLTQTKPNEAEICQIICIEQQQFYFL